MNKLAEKQKEVNAFLEFIREEEEKDELEF